jgi:hypothetical protein
LAHNIRDDGAISVLFAPLVLLVLGKRQAIPAATPGQDGHFRGGWELVKKPSYLAIVGAAACIAVAGYSVTTFAPAFLIRVHGMSLGRALLLIVPAMQMLAIFFYFLASRRFVREIVAA